jgi:hypothetical protein
LPSTEADDAGRGGTRTHPPFDLSRAALEAHAVEMDQFAGIRRVELEHGEPLLHVWNAAGLTLDLLPNRALDLGRVAWRGRPLTWLSRNAPHAADAGADWLERFNGGLLATCGLRHAGPAEVDPESGERRALHGDVGRLRAARIGARQGWEGDRYWLRAWGEIAEAALFGPQLVLRREVAVPLDEATIEIHDRVENVGDAPQPLMVLYHANVGYPLVREGAELTVSGGTPTPRDHAARAGLPDWQRWGPPEPGRPEEVFFHRPAADEHDWTGVVLGSEALAVELAWDARSAPWLTQWKNTQRGIYVSGIEPGNCLPEGQNRARAQGRLDMLEPGEAREFALRFRVLEGAAVAAARRGVERLAEAGRPIAPPLDDYPR